MPELSFATITQLYCYPIKSCAPIGMDRVFCQRTGFPFDRSFVLSTESADKIFTQRDLPKLSLLQPFFVDESELGLRDENEREIIVPNSDNGELLKISVWGNDYLAVDQGKEINSWLSEVIGVPCRLLKRAENSRTQELLRQDGTRFDAAFVDCCPLSIVYEDELETLNRKLEKPVQVSRFRPSIVMRNLSGSIQPEKSSLSINEVTLDYIRPIGRCVIINIDQENGVLKGSEPLKVLASYNLVNNKAALGHYYVAEKSGLISIGDVARPAIMTSA